MHVLLEKLWSSSRSRRLDTGIGLETCGWGDGVGWRDGGGVDCFNEQRVPLLRHAPHEFGASSHFTMSV